jgi:basic membrane lipoprotein Med (substrate-binding protein (PBP1-ABC) superfamily)
MTFFLHIPEVEQGISQANKAFGTVNEEDAEQVQQKLVAALDQMLSFAENNLNNMLSLMGFSSMDELNRALQNYNNLNLSL